MVVQTAAMGPAVRHRRALDGIRSRVRENIAVHQLLLENTTLISDIHAATEILVRCFQGGNKLLAFGNGGSSSDAQHIVGEFVSRVFIDRPGLPAVALGANFTVASALANDYDYERVFSNQIVALGQPGDVALGLSTSGNSVNVMRALSEAQGRGMRTIALAGQTQGRWPAGMDVLLRVPATMTPRVQECHILIGHIISELVETRLFGPESEEDAA